MTKPRDLRALHTEALERFKVTAQAEDRQRVRELEDLRFADPIEPGDQWPADALSSRKGLNAQGGLPPVPARPSLTINKLRQPIQQVTNQQRQARLSLSFAPEGEEAIEEVAEAFEDITRAIQTDSRAHLARNWAFDRAAKCGRGFYRIETEYVSPRSFDQKIVYRRIVNQFSVYFYPFCQEPDYSDSEWCFLTEDLPWPVYKRKYGESALAGYDEDELSSTGDDKPGWIADTDQGKTVRVAEYYFFETTADTLQLIQTANGSQVVYKSERAADDPAVVLDERPIERRQLKWAKLNAVEFLHEVGEDPIVDRDGQYIPVIPVIADESNINGDRRYTGLVRPARDAQRLFNVEASALAEAVHLGPVAPFIGYATQFEGYESWWAQLNTRRFPYLPINPPKNPNEAALPVPQRNTAEQPIQAIVASLAQADSYIKATTGIFDPSLGNLNPSDRSGRAILALQKQAEIGTSGYVDNLANMSLLLEGKILRDLIPKIYDRPGRVVSGQGEDDERAPIMLNRPFLRDPKRGLMPAAPDAPGAKTIDLRKGEYAIVPTVGKSYTTRREEGVASMGELAQAAPNLLQYYADVWVGAMDFPGARQIADRLEKLVPPQVKDQGQGPDPQVLQQQLGQLQHVMQLMTQELNAKNEIIQKDQLKYQTELERTRLDNDSKLVVAAINAEAGITEAEIKAGMADFQNRLDFLHNRLEGIAAAAEQGRDHRHELEMQLLQHRQALEQGQQQHDQAMEQGDQQHQQALEQGDQSIGGQLAVGQQAADNAPQPASSTEGGA